MPDEGGRERHPIRSLVIAGVFAGLIYSAIKFFAEQKKEYAGLTESQARDKLVEKMAPRVGDDTAGDIADQVIPKLKDRGLIKADPIEDAGGEVEKVADQVADATDQKVAEAADEVADAVESVVKD